MRFYGRTEEIATLRRFWSVVQNRKTAQMVSVFGRRRVGKTTLIRKAFENETAPVLSFMVQDRSEASTALGHRPFAAPLTFPTRRPSPKPPTSSLLPCRLRRQNPPSSSLTNAKPSTAGRLLFGRNCRAFGIGCVTTHRCSW